MEKITDNEMETGVIYGFKELIYIYIYIYICLYTYTHTHYGNLS